MIDCKMFEIEVYNLVVEGVEMVFFGKMFYGDYFGLEKILIV